MPKEVVRSSLLAPDGVAPFQVEVRWNKEIGDVSIATVDPAVEDSFSRESGLHVGLDRREINDLIRYLRRARDQAFGRDE